MTEKEKQTETGFKPDHRMLKFLEGLLNPDVGTKIEDLCEYAGVSRVTYWRWRQNEQFCDWLAEAHAAGMVKILPHLDKIGVKFANRGNYQFFEFMQRKYGKVPGQIESGMKEMGKGLGEMLASVMYGEKEDGENDPGKAA